MREVGIVIDKEAAKDPTTRVKTILIQNTKLCKQPFESLESFASKNHAQITSNNSNDSDDGERSYSSEPKQSLGGKEQNRAKNMGPNDVNDTLHSLPGHC